MPEQLRLLGSRRDYGETIDDLVQLFAPHFVGNFTRYAGCWDRLAVDSHALVALVAPGPVFATGGTTDQWTGVEGIFQALGGRRRL